MKKLFIILGFILVFTITIITGQKPLVLASPPDTTNLITSWTYTSYGMQSKYESNYMSVLPNEEYIIFLPENIYYEFWANSSTNKIECFNDGLTNLYSTEYTYDNFNNVLKFTIPNTTGITYLKITIWSNLGFPYSTGWDFDDLDTWLTDNSVVLETSDLMSDLFYDQDSYNLGYANGTADSIGLWTDTNSDGYDDTSYTGGYSKATQDIANNDSSNFWLLPGNIIGSIGAFVFTLGSVEVYGVTPLMVLSVLGTFTLLVWGFKIIRG